MKASKIASIVYYALMAISVVVLLLFFCVGFGNMESLPSGYYRSPQFTDFLMYWMYALIAICGLCTLVGAVTSKGGKVDSNMPKWGKIMASVGLWLFVPVLVIAWFMADTTPVMTGTGLYEQTGWLAMTEAMMYTIYALLIAALAGLLLGLSGILKR